MIDLAAYLTAAVRQRWQPGVIDCCTFPGNWVVSWGLGDPMAEWRGAYRSDAGAIRFIRQAGSLVSLWDCGLTSIGVAPVHDLRAGDVGVIRAADGVFDQVGAIHTGDKWAFRGYAGLTFAPAECIAAWGQR